MSGTFSQTSMDQNEKVKMQPQLVLNLWNYWLKTLIIWGILKKNKNILPWITHVRDVWRLKDVHFELKQNKLTCVQELSSIRIQLQFNSSETMITSTKRDQLRGSNRLLR